jgi:hypothetical protein
MPTTASRRITAGSRRGSDRCAGSSPSEGRRSSSPVSFVQNVRRENYELGVDGPATTRVAEAFADLALVL